MTKEPQQPDKESPLRKRREELGLTQREIAAALDKTVQTISNWETGLYEPKMTPREVKRLCRLLNWTLEDMPDEFAAPKE
ncbi:MAG TPA: helix-turn-helix transcriptional regulator [Coleofasciculaceae cyanobacterium]|jgi:transcriptional regulator with XRE-family HTH domain